VQEEPVAVREDHEQADGHFLDGLSEERPYEVPPEPQRLHHQR